MEDYERKALERLNNQEAKQDFGKIQMALVSPEIIEAVGRVRTYGVMKYGNINNYKLVEPFRYKNAMMRHLVEYLKDENSRDDESGLLHLEHLACNVAFLLEFLYEQLKKSSELK